MKNILITGGAGFIGSNLAIKLIENGYIVTVLDSLNPQIHGNDPINTSGLYRSIKEKVNFIHGSVTNREDWLKALAGQDAIIHLAAETGTGQSMYEIQKYTDVNIGGTALMLDVLANSKNKVSKVLVASSRAIYGEGRYFCSTHGEVYPTARMEEDMQNGDFNCKCPICRNNVKLLSTDEESKIHPTSVYGITKQTQESLVMEVCSSLGIHSVAFRYQNVFGAGQSLSNPYTGILSIFSTRIKNGNSINIFEDGQESRDFVYIDDVVEATFLGLQSDEANGQVFNVGTGIPTSVLDVASGLVKNYSADVSLNVSGNFRLGDIRHNYADISKIQDKLNFQPQFTFNTGLAKFVQWVNEQAIVEDRYEASILEMKSKGLYK